MTHAAHGGRERRRKDAVGRLRRLAYGILLWTAVPAATAAEETLGHHDVRPLDSGSSISSPALNFRLAAANLEHPGLLPAKATLRTLFSFRLEDELSILRKGVGFDLALPQLGTVYLNLYSREDSGIAGKRWKLHDETRTQRLSTRWLLGGTVDLVRDDPNGPRQVNVNPQLLLDVDDLFGMNSHCEARFQYANWEGSGEDAPVGRVPQVRVKWRF